MTKKIDITDKLSFDENPVIVIKGKELEVNADAATVLKIMGILGNNESPSPSDVLKMYNLIFGEKERKEIEKMSFQFNDFQTIIFTAIDLIVGEQEDQGE